MGFGDLDSQSGIISILQSSERILNHFWSYRQRILTKITTDFIDFCFISLELEEFCKDAKINRVSPWGVGLECL